MRYEIGRCDMTMELDQCSITIEDPESGENMYFDTLLDAKQYTHAHKVLVCGTCDRTIKSRDPFWHAYYSKQVFCSASCALIAQGCTHYTSGDSYDRIFIERSIDEKAWNTIRTNLSSTNVNQMRSEITDYRFDLDF